MSAPTNLIGLAWDVALVALLVYLLGVPLVRKVVRPTT